MELTIHARHSERVGDGEIRYTFYRDGEMVGHKTVDVATKRSLLERLRTLTEDIDKPRWTPDDVEQLTTIGQQLFTLLVPANLRPHLFPGSSRSIALDVQDHDIPWEILHDGQGFLAHRHAIGRKVIGPRANARRWRPAVRVAVVGDPTEQFEGARRESEIVRRRCESALKALGERWELASEVIHLEGEEATKEAVLLDLLMSSTDAIDLFHFAGHADFDPHDPDNSGIALANETSLRAFEARSLGSTPLVFVNGCRAAQPLDSSITFGALSGFAAEFMAGGAVGYIAPAWPVDDGVAQQFAVCFYEHLISGETVGASLLAAKRSTEGPDALAYTFYGDVEERLPIFSPETVDGPFVNELGIDKIISTERKYHALEMLAVNDLPWILWDATDIEEWADRLPIDRLRRDVVVKTLSEYVEEFGDRVARGEKRFFCVINGKLIRGYLKRRGEERWSSLSERLDGYLELPNFTLIVALPELDEIEEIELVSKSPTIPPSSTESVYVFNKQTRFETSALSYNLFEDYNPQMITQYWARLEALIDAALADYTDLEPKIRYSSEFSRAVNRQTEEMLSALATEALGAKPGDQARPGPDPEPIA